MNRNFYKRGQGGFALGLILVVIALIAVISVAMSSGFRGASGGMDIEKSNTYASAIRSHGMAIRDLIRSQMSAENYSLGNRLYDCTGSNCIKDLVKFRKIPDEAFDSVQGGNDLYQQWRYNTAYQFSNSGSAVNLDTYVLRRPIKQNICTLIESRNKSRAIAASDVPLIGQIDFGSAEVFTASAANWMPVSVDGCFRVITMGSTFYYYYVIIGKGS